MEVKLSLDKHSTQEMLGIAAHLEGSVCPFPGGLSSSSTRQAVCGFHIFTETSWHTAEIQSGWKLYKCTNGGRRRHTQGELLRLQEKRSKRAPSRMGGREGTESPPTVPMGMFPLWCPLSSSGVTGHDDNTSMTRFWYF